MRVAVGGALPENYYRQDELLRELQAIWSPALPSASRLEKLHRNSQVEGRHLALPIDEYARLDSFDACNQAFARCAVDLGGRAMSDVLQRTGISAKEIDHLVCVSSTGISTPSIDALLVNRLGLRRDVKRTPIFGLGCVAGAAGLTRLRDWLAADARQVGLLLSVELCSLTFQRGDVSVPNLISAGLFGDGAAAAIMVGEGRELDGPEILATRSVFYPNTEGIMGWRIGRDGFQIVLSADLPQLIRDHLRGDVSRFLAEQGLALADLQSYVLHPGGPRVLEAFQDALALPPAALELSYATLRAMGNLSSASVLFVLRETIAHRRPPPGSLGLLLAMGPGFCSELILLRW